MNNMNIKQTKVVQTNNNNCLHDNCSICNWSWKDKRWKSCTHMISCPCKKCSIMC